MDQQQQSSHEARGLTVDENPEPRGFFIRAPAPRLAILVLMLLFAAMLYAFIEYATGGSEWGFAGIGIGCTLVVTLPFLDRRIGALSMWGVLWFVVLIGAGVRGLMISTGYPDAESIEILFLLGKSFDELQLAAVVTFAAVSLLTAAFYLSATHQLSRASKMPLSARKAGPDSTEVSSSVVACVVVGYAVVGAVATAVYSISVGGTESSISDRRTIYTGDQDYQSYGVASFLAGASVVALMIYVAYILQLRRKLRLVDLITMLLLVANAFAINVVTTTRTDLLFVSVGLLFVVVSVREKVPVIASAVGATGILGGIAYLTAERGGREVAQNQLLNVGIESGLLNRNAFDLSKTLHIITAVPDLLPYQWGSTIATYIFAPVPRAIWPDKPLVSPGPIIGDSLYGLANTGIPPGMIAELVWNFGPVLALGLVPIIGYFLGKIEIWALSFDRFDILSLCFYATVVLPLGKAVIGVAIGQAVSAGLQAFSLLVPGAIILLVLSGSPDTSVGHFRPGGRAGGRRG